MYLLIHLQAHQPQIHKFINSQTQELINSSTHELINSRTQKLINLQPHQLKALNLYLLFYNIALIFAPF